MKRTIFYLLLLLPLLTLVSCDDDVNTPVEQKVETLAITPDQATMTIGESLQLQVTQQPNLNKPVTFRSLNAELATVSDKGVVTAVAKGETTILAEVDGVSAACKITIQEPAPKEDFAIEILRVTATNVYIKVTPKDPEMLYSVNAGTRESYDRILNNLQNQPNANREWWKAVSGDEIGSAGYREAMARESFKGTREFDLGEISGSDYPYPADHTIVARIYGMDQDGYELTKVIELEQKTKPRTMLNFTFNVENLTPSDSWVSALVRPSDMTKSYFYAIQSKRYVDFYRNPKPGNEVLDGVPAKEMMCYKLVQSVHQMDPMPDAFKTGELQINEETNTGLTPNTDYVLVLFGWDKDLGLTTDPAYFDFKTKPAEGE